MTPIGAAGDRNRHVDQIVGHEETVRENTRPARWTNPVPAPRYQLVVIRAEGRILPGSATQRYH